MQTAKKAVKDRMIIATFSDMLCWTRSAIGYQWVCVQLEIDNSRVSVWMRESLQRQHYRKVRLDGEWLRIISLSDASTPSFLRRPRCKCKGCKATSLDGETIYAAFRGASCINSRKLPPAGRLSLSIFKICESGSKTGENHWCDCQRRYANLAELNTAERGMSTKRIWVVLEI